MVPRAPVDTVSEATASLSSCCINSRVTLMYDPGNALSEHSVVELASCQNEAMEPTGGEVTTRAPRATELDEEVTTREGVKVDPAQLTRQVTSDPCEGGGDTISIRKRRIAPQNEVQVVLATVHMVPAAQSREFEVRAVKAPLLDVKRKTLRTEVMEDRPT